MNADLPTQHAHKTPTLSATATSTLIGKSPAPPLGPMVRPFPVPGPTLRTAMEQLQQAALDPFATDEELRELAQLPRPWDPGTCTETMRAELWTWLDLVAMWVNEQHLWNVTRPGIPECWPAHPHLVHDLAVLACTRYYTSFAVTPAALEDWHRYGLPAFLERVRDRLGDGCQPARHQPRPRNERDDSHAAPAARAIRKKHYLDDANDTRRAAGDAGRSDRIPLDPDQLHETW
jgi:hypothetical protein